MSKALKCDVCKKCFDPVEVGDEEYFVTIPEFYCQNGEQYQNREVGYREEEVHMCPDCSRKFAMAKFLTRRQKNHDSSVPNQ